MSSGSSLRALVVGGTSGIGRGIALALADAKVSVSICGRDESRGKGIVESLATKHASGEHDFFRCDATRLKNVMDTCQTFAARHKQLDLLVLTQGIASVQGYTPTEDGIDAKLAVHYYSRMAFIEALLPALRRSPRPRVLSVLSAGVHGPYKAYESDVTLEKSFSLKAAADAAGFYNDLTLDTYSRAPENSNVAFFHAAPGFVNTSWGTEMPLAIKALVRVLQVAGRSPEKSGQYLSAPLLSDKLGPGLHLLDKNGRPGQKLTALHTDAAREFVWKHTQEVLKRAGVAPISPISG